VTYSYVKMAMTDEHRKRLRAKRVALVKDMRIDEEFLSCLMPSGVITSNMKEEIEVGVTFAFS